jgi:CheY-like chemotaxis protein
VKPIEVIHRNAEAQVKLIDDILDVSRIITGKLRAEPKATDLVALARNAIEVVRPSAEAKCIGIELRAERDPWSLVADPDRVQQAVWNLLSNSVKFTDAGGSIRLAVFQDGPQVAISVSDTGKGIAPEFLPFVFDRFCQADASLARQLGGLGLGLSLVRHISELHGGRVTVASDGLGKGSTFTITLPIRAVAPPSALERPSARQTDRTEEGQTTIRGVRVLVVEDDADARELLKTVLEDGGASVDTAASAEEGLERLSDFRPDVLVSDIGMPIVDGYAFMRRVRALRAAEGGAIPAVALTAYAREEDRMKALSAGFTTHLAKPITPDVLGAVVRNLASVARRP